MKDIRSTLKNDKREIVVTLEGTPQTAYHVVTVKEGGRQSSSALTRELFYRLERETAAMVGDPPYGPHYAVIINHWIESGEYSPALTGVADDD